MNIFLVFATNSGATDMVSQIVEQELTAKGHTVTRKQVRDANPDEFTNFEVILLASPSWDFDGKEGMPHEDYVPFMDKAKGKTFENKPFAVFGLGDSSYTHFCGAVDHLEEFVKSLKGKLVVESIRIDGFYYRQDVHTQAVKEWAEKLHKSLSGS